MKTNLVRSARFHGVAAVALALMSGAANGQARPAPQQPPQRGAGAAQPAGDGLIEAARAKYAADSWTRGERRDGFVLEDVTLPGLTGQEVEFRASDVARGYADASGKKRVLVEMSASDRVGAAHAALLQHLAFVQSTKTLETAAARGIAAGDVGYVAYGGKDGAKIAWIAFVVGNLEFRVLALDVDAPGAIDLKPVVELIAARALAMPPLAAGPMTRPNIESFTAESATLAAGASALLTIAATDPTGRAPRFDFVVGGAKQGEGYVEQDEQGRWRFHATGPGRTKVTLRVLGRNGTVATKDVELEIAAQ